MTRRVIDKCSSEGVARDADGGSLKQFRERLDELIGEYGEDAQYSYSVDDYCFTETITIRRFETDAEYAHRCQAEASSVALAEQRDHKRYLELKARFEPSA